MPADRKWRFTSDDMANIQAHLEEMLVPSDTNSKAHLTANSNGKAMPTANWLQQASITPWSVALGSNNNLPVDGDNMLKKQTAGMAFW